VKVVLTIFFLLFTGFVFSQNQASNFNRIDNFIQSIDSDDPATLSRLLTAPFNTEKEKVRAIFRWITENIGYYRNVSVSSRNKAAGRYIVYEEEDDDDGELKALNERVALRVLKVRKTYCEGYARLFKSLCDHAGIVAEIITGYARTDMNRLESSFRSNHSWNAVRIDSVWHLLDVTWASGYITMFSGDFVKKYDDYYFLTDPAEFIKHHLPDDIRWTLLDDPPAPYEFRYTPFKQRSFIKYNIREYYPSKGIVQASVGDTLVFELETTVPYKNILIAPDSLWDSAAIVYSPFYAYVHPGFYLAGNKTRYVYAVESDRVKWIYLMYNNDAVLRYRLNVRTANAKN
jgi:transglutaminase/protease-like cytokinesis protein 3